MSEGVLLVLLSCKDLMRPHRHAGMMECARLGDCYYRTGDYGRARELHEQHRAICEALGDREGVARACGNLGLCYYRTGDYGRAR